MHRRQCENSEIYIFAISYDANELMIKINSGLDHIRKWHPSLRSKRFLPIELFSESWREGEGKRKLGGGGRGREKRKVLIFFPPPPPSFPFFALFPTFWTNLRGNASLQATETPSTIKSMLFTGSSNLLT